MLSRAANVPSTQGPKPAWLCLCDCGATKIVKGVNLRTKQVKSCGCAKRDHIDKRQDGPKRRLPAGVATRNKVLLKYKRHAANAGREWGFTDAEFLAITSMDCHYCGIPPARVVRSWWDSIRYNGIDRLDNAIGYVPSNCVPCCSTCNHAKHTMSVADFEGWIDRLVAFRQRAHA